MGNLASLEFYVNQQWKFLQSMYLQRYLQRTRALCTEIYKTINFKPKIPEKSNQSL